MIADEERPKFYYAIPELNWYSVTPREVLKCYHADCDQYTWIPPYCPMHLDMANLWIGPSIINGAGRGLFALSDKLENPNAIIFKKGDRICLYGDNKVNVFTNEDMN